MDCPPRYNRPCEVHAPAAAQWAPEPEQRRRRRPDYDDHDDYQYDDRYPPRGRRRDPYLTPHRGSAGLRYRMLDTVRTYGLTHLNELGEETALRRRHREYYRTVTDQLAHDHHSAREQHLLTRLRDDLPNIRTALSNAVTSGDIDTGLATIANINRSRGWFFVGACVLILLISALVLLRSMYPSEGEKIFGVVQDMSAALKAKDMDRIASHLRNSFALRLRTPQQVATQVSAFLALTGDVGSINRYQAQYARVTAADARKLAALAEDGWRFCVKAGAGTPEAAKGLYFDDRLVSLHSEERRASSNNIRLGDPPLDDLHVTAGRSKMRHHHGMLHFGLQCSARPLLPNRRIIRLTSAAIARRPATSTSLSRPEPMHSYGFAFSGTARQASRSAPRNACFNRLPTLILRTPISIATCRSSGAIDVAP